MSKVTYTKTQLRGFQLEELKQLPLYGLVEDREDWGKTKLIDALLDAQLSITDEVIEKVVKETKKEVVVIIEEKKKPVVFHRKRVVGFNPMNFKRK